MTKATTGLDLRLKYACLGLWRSSRVSIRSIRKKGVPFCTYTRWGVVTGASDCSRRQSRQDGDHKVFRMHVVRLLADEFVVCNAKTLGEAMKHRPLYTFGVVS